MCVRVVAAGIIVVLVFAATVTTKVSSGGAGVRGHNDKASCSLLEYLRRNFYSTRGKCHEFGAVLGRVVSARRRRKCREKKISVTRGRGRKRAGWYESVTSDDVPGFVTQGGPEQSRGTSLIKLD